MPPERSSDHYSSGITVASKSVLLEIMTILRSYREALVLVGGWVPYFLLEKYRLPDNRFTHAGSIDIDLAVDPSKVSAQQYATIVELLKARGYRPAPDRVGDPIPYVFEREIVSPADRKAYKIRVDFLTHQEDPRARPDQHRHLPVQDGLLARKTKGCEAAFQHKTTFDLTGMLPEGGQITVPIQMADLVGCLTMKGIVLGERYREKDAYDIYALVANYQQGPRDVATILRPHLSHPLVKEAVARIHTAFATREAHGPVWVAEFLHPNSPTEKDRLTTDAFMTVHELDVLMFNPEAESPAADLSSTLTFHATGGEIRTRPEAFLKDRRRVILEELNGRPYYVMSATPTVTHENVVNVADEKLRDLLRQPPGQRHAGWNLDLDVYGTIKPSFNGMVYEIPTVPDYKRIEVFRNGHLEFRVPIEPDGFRAQDVVVQEPVDSRNPQGPKKSVSHTALGAVPTAEYPVSFCRFVKEYAQLLGLGGREAWLVSIALYNVKGIGLFEVSRDIGWGPQREPNKFWPEDHLEVPAYRVSWTEPPDQIARRALDRIWNAFGYERPPYFDANGNFVVPTR